MTPQERAVAEAVAFVETLNRVVIFPTIALLSSVAFLLFLWGCFEYFINASNEEGRRKGVRNITFGIIGLVVMVSAFAILSIFTATFGLDQQLRCADNPDAANCDDAFVIPEFVPTQIVDPPDDGETPPVDPPDDGEETAVDPD